ncbi:MAG: chorismate synthase [Elusimicrobiota bacterium]
MIRYYTAGESHGKSVTVILEGIPAGLKITPAYINKELARRQKGYGRGKRMEIEKDKVEITSGVRLGETIGSPICMVVKNRDWPNWKETMSVDKINLNRDEILTEPRPGHADLAGVLKYNRNDMRDILERASARETAARVAAGAVAKKLLNDLKIDVVSFTKQIGKVKTEAINISPRDIPAATEDSPLRCIDKEAEAKMIEEIEKAKEAGDTVGGVFSVVVEGLPPGLGSHTQWDLKLDGKIAQALMSIQAIKGVETGRGFDMAKMRGSKVHDEIKYNTDKKEFYRTSNNAGGFEGGMSNGENLIFNAVMKPISSLRKPLASVDMKTKREIKSAKVRSDVCAVPAAGVVGEAAVALEISKALKSKTGGDSFNEMQRNYKNYLRQISEY